MEKPTLILLASPSHYIIKFKSMLWALISFLVVLFVLAIVIWVIKLILDMLTIPEPAKTIAYLILGLIGLVFLISAFSSMHLATCASLFCR